MIALESIAEQRILEAMARGELEGLPGSGRRLDLEDDSLVPVALRLAYRVLKNAGFLPEEVALRREVAGIRAMLGTIQDHQERRRAHMRLALLNARLATRGPGCRLDLEGHYGERLTARLAGSS